MERQKAESDQGIGQLKHEAAAHIANIAEKLEAHWNSEVAGGKGDIG